MWGVLPESSTVTNTGAACVGIPALTLNKCYIVIGNTINNGGSSWANISFVYENNTIIGSAWIAGTGKLMLCRYILIGS